MATEFSSNPTSDNPSATLSLVPIPCTMCTKQEPSICRCKTCIHYLCRACNFAHKSMVCFQNHEVVLIEEDDSGIKQYLNPKSENKAESAEVKNNIPESISYQLEKMLTMGQNQLELLFKLKSELQQSLSSLGVYRLTVIGEVNDMHTKFQEQLKNKRDAIIKNLDEHLAEKFYVLSALKNQTGDNISDLLTQMATYKYLATGENINGEISNSDPDSGIENASSVFSSLDLNAINFTAQGQDNLAQDVNSAAAVNLPALIANNSDVSLTSDTCSVSCNNKRVNSIEIYKTFGQKGSGLGLLNSPHGFCLGFDEDIIVADTSNHRVQVFTKTGELKYQFGISGRHDGHLWHPRKVVLLPRKKEFVVCDRGYERSRMQIFSEDGKFIKKIYIQYIDIVSGITINDKESIVVVDSVTPTIFVLGDNEYLRSIDCSHFMEEPSDIAILEKNYYICDFKAHNICVVNEDGVLLKKLGNKQITTFPNGIDILPSGHILVGDSHGNFFHISIYTKDGDLIADFRCPYIKVSRCCGLKVTKEGHLVTVDKNYHHVIMLENIYPHLASLNSFKY